MCLCGCEQGDRATAVEERDSKEKVFLICPVRGHEKNELQGLVDKLSKQFQVHWPHRDTDQSGATGLRICWDNYNAIKEADKVIVVWNGESLGSHFDLGMAFALGKYIQPVMIENQVMKFGKLEATQGKSFNNMINRWNDFGPLQNLEVVKIKGGNTCIVEKTEDHIIHHPID